MTGELKLRTARMKAEVTVLVRMVMMEDDRMYEGYWWMMDDMARWLKNGGGWSNSRCFS
jgi:hypothetical protein